MEAADSTPSMICSRSKRCTRTRFAICRSTSSTAALPWRDPRKGNRSTGPWTVQSISSSISGSTSLNWRSLMARCNARERRQRLCSVMGVVPRMECVDSTARRLRWRQGTLGCGLFQQLSFEIERTGQNTIAVFALHKCGDFLNLPFVRCAGSVRDGDVGVPPGKEAKGDGACNPAQNGAARHEAEEHQHAAI